jgi:hypothetical protein
MSSERQIEANRLNAQRSTGPQTEEGKAKVASNALKHGLTGKRVALPGEDPNAYDAFLAHMIGALAPEGALEEVLAEKIVADAWRLKRIPEFEAALHRGQDYQIRLAVEYAKVKSHEMSAEEKMIGKSPMDEIYVRNNDFRRL